MLGVGVTRARKTGGRGNYFGRNGQRRARGGAGFSLRSPNAGRSLLGGEGILCRRMTQEVGRGGNGQGMLGDTAKNLAEWEGYRKAVMEEGVERARLIKIRQNTNSLASNSKSYPPGSGDLMKVIVQESNLRRLAWWQFVPRMGGRLAEGKKTGLGGWQRNLTFRKL